MEKLKIGDRVIHSNHGTGVIVYSYGNGGSFLVRFDKPVPHWGMEVEVSTALLKKKGGK